MEYKRNRIRAKSLIKRLGGLSAFGFGGSWKASEPDCVVVRDVITALEDKRALYTGAAWEQPDHVVQSILKIREELTNGLKRIDDKTPAKEAFRTMRAACRDFLTKTDRISTHHFRGGYMSDQEMFFVELGKLRAIFGQQLATLGYLYGVDIEEGLASILPPDGDKWES